MSDTKRTLAAGFLIALLTLFIPFYLTLIGVDSSLEPSSHIGEVSDGSPSSVPQPPPAVEVFSAQTNNLNLPSSQDLVQFSVVSNKYKAGLNNVGGGSITDFSIVDFGEKNHQYLGGYNNLGEYDELSPVTLVNSSDPFVCSPCLEPAGQKEKLISGLFTIKDAVLYKPGFSSQVSIVGNSQTINLFDGDSLVVSMEAKTDYGNITKKTVFSNDSFIIKHFYSFGRSGDFNLIWGEGMLPTEKNLSEEITYSQAFIAQNKEIEDMSLSPSSLDDVSDLISKRGLTDWVALRNKYFINALISNNAVGGEMEGYTKELSPGLFVPAYKVGLILGGVSSFGVSQYLGPLDIDLIEESNTYLDRVMNFGWLPIQPFSRSVLWVLKSLHLTGLNYGIILILFAFLIRLITGPLTKKSFQSTQKMQTVQPKMKKIQEKHKGDSQKLNQEMVKLYKTEGVNPLGGCLPMLIQMPLLFSLFIVFRSTIEFRGAPFVFWIDNLSQPDVLFNLPFYIPVYGGHVGFLPIVLGVSMFLSQRLSMATMDKSQKPMMYFMTAFFFLLFNQFPSGLNLYYTVYNILNYFQQKGLKRA